jgi:hypothetical protein
MGIRPIKMESPEEPHIFEPLQSADRLGDPVFGFKNHPAGHLHEARLTRHPEFRPKRALNMRYLLN